MKKGFRILGLLSLFLLLLGVTVVYGYPDFSVDGVFPAGKYRICILWALPDWREKWELGGSIPPHTDYPQDYPISMGTGALHKIFKQLSPGECKEFCTGWKTPQNPQGYLKDFGLYLNDKTQGNFSGGGLFRTYEIYEDAPHVRITEEPSPDGRVWRVEFDTWLDGNFDDLGIRLQQLPLKQCP